MEEKVRTEEKTKVAKTAPTAAPKIRNPKEENALKRERDWKMVEGRFENFEQPGGTIEFNFLKWAEDPVQFYKLTDGQVYKIPLMVARHLVENGAYPEYKWTVNEEGLPAMKVSRLTHRYGFQNLEFVEISDLDARFDLETRYEEIDRSYAIEVRKY